LGLDHTVGDVPASETGALLNNMEYNGNGTSSQGGYVVDRSNVGPGVPEVLLIGDDSSGVLMGSTPSERKNKSMNHHIDLRMTHT
jgi:hypothetical protein